MEIVRGTHEGAYINFYLCSVRTGIVNEVEGIAIEEDDFYWVLPVFKKYYPDFDIYDTANPIKKDACNNIARDLEKILYWMKTEVKNQDIDYYKEYLAINHNLPSNADLICFLEELIKYMWEQEGWLNSYDYVNLEGFWQKEGHKCNDI